MESENLSYCEFLSDFLQFLKFGSLPGESKRFDAIP